MVSGDSYLGFQISSKITSLVGVYPTCSYMYHLMHAIRQTQGDYKRQTQGDYKRQTQGDYKSSQSFS